MSRVRVLNLPKDCTEEQLKQHFLSHLPADAPPLQITDVFIKRADPRSSRHYPRKAPVALPLGIIRMAFVGFQTAVAAKFVVEHFDKSFFRSARIHVELAQSVQAAREKKELEQEAMQRKRQREALQKARQREQEHERNAAEEDATSPVQKKWKRNETSNAVEEGERSAEEQRRSQFVSERDAATSGPSWTSELLLPEGSGGPSATSESSTAWRDPALGAEAAAERQQTTQKKQKDRTKRKNTTSQSVEQTTTTTTSEEENEEAIRQRQAALGEVSEMDFLSQLGGHASARAEGAPPEEDAVVEGHAQGVRDHEEEADNSGKKNLKKSSSKREKKAVEDPGESPEAIASRTRRVCLYNFPYVATEQQLKQFVTSRFGSIESLHIPLTRDTRQSKGAAFVRFARSEDAVACVKEMFGNIFMGRLMKVKAVEEDPYQLQAAVNGEGGAATGAPNSIASAFKSQKEKARQEEEEAVMMNLMDQKKSTSTSKNVVPPASWNALYLNSSAAVQRVAERLHLQSNDLVRVDTKGAATRAAIAEALLTSETQHLLGDEGIALDVLEGGHQNLLRPRSSTTILVKNLGLKSAAEVSELTALFARHGVLEVTAFPRSGLFALFRYSQAQDARVAFRRLSFKLFGGAPLYLEWAPVGSVKEPDDEDEDEGTAGHNETEKNSKAKGLTGRHSRDGEDEDEDLHDSNAASRQAVAAATQVFILFITNIPFELQDEEELYAFLLDACPRFASKPEAFVKRLVFEKDKGRAFVTLDSAKSFAYAQQRWHGKKLRDRVLSCVASKTTSAALNADKHIVSGSVASGSGRPAPEEEEDHDELMPPALQRRQRDPAASRVPPGADPLKIVVKNLPFEATEQDVRTLFSAFSEVRSVRLPRKAQQFSHHRENHHRGFAFVEFLSETEAARAIQTLRATHLYGRHLVLEYAKAGA